MARQLTRWQRHAQAVRARSFTPLRRALRVPVWGDLTARLLAVPGVVDGVVLQLPAEGDQPVGRIAALVVAPELDEATLLAALRREMDPVFLPRPLRRVQALPRNETGKLPRQALLELLQGH